MITLTDQYKLKPSKQQEIEINQILDVFHQWIIDN